MEPPSPVSQPTGGKIRLMCSYGGHIVPLPHMKSLFYSGGDTRIITFPAASTASLSAFSAHMAAALYVSNPFNLKYQLPLHDLDSLISLSSDDDLQIFLEEFHRLSSSPAPARIRLFLFFSKQPLGYSTSQPVSSLKTTQCGLTHPKTESWFVDALQSAKMMQKGEMVGFCGDGQSDGQSGGLCGQESMMLETTSSFGSSSSSVSFSNLPPIMASGDENVSALQENRTKLPSADSTASDISSVASAISHRQTGCYQDPTVHVTALENKSSLNPFESPDITASEVRTHKVVQVSGYPLSSQLDQLQRQQVQFVPMDTHFVHQNPAGAFPTVPYYPVYNTPPHQPQPQPHYLPNQAYPVYLVPVGQSQIYDSSTQYGCKDSLPVVTGRPPLHPNSTLISSQVTYKEATPAPPIPEFVSQAYRTTPVANSLVHVAYNENKQQNMTVPQMRNQPQLFGVAPRESANYGNEHDDDSVRAQIYKSQPPPPTLPSQYQTMMQATTVLLSEASAQLHMDNIKQQVRASQPQ
ncbi:hypothetical protein AB3S75_029795 [Citrus x aurantiifolia]